MKKILLLFAVVAMCLMPVSDASAHVLVMDETKTSGAVLHVIPDDDPVAGEPSSLYFDMQDELTGGDEPVRLSIKDSQGAIATPEISRNGSLVTAAHTFPTQGVYEISYTVTSGDKEYIFQQTQRVSRGVSLSGAEEPFHAWAQGLLVVSIFGPASVAIIVFNRRKEIAKQSTF